MNPSDTNHHEEELVRRVLEAVGPRHALPHGLRERWETAFREEFDQVVTRRRRVKRIVLSALAASVAAVAIAVGLLDSPIQRMHPVAHAVSVHGHSELVGEGTVTPGMTVAAQQSIETGPRSHVSLRYHQADVRLGVDSTVQFHDDRLVLLSGTLYVDTGADPSNHRPVVIETKLGTLSHVGTQFMVDLHDATLTAAVREGTIVLTTDAASDAFSADGREAKLVSISELGEIDVHIAPTHGGIWAWVIEASPGFERASASQHAFLTWLAREMGTTLIYESDAARSHASIKRITGLAGLPIDEAIEVVNATTHLDVSSDEGPELRVRLKE